MTKVPVETFRAKRGAMQAQITQNRLIGLAPTLFYTITIPLEPFDSGFEWDEQPLHTAFRLDFIELPVKDWRTLAGRIFAVPPDKSDGSIYVGTAHNPVDIRHLAFTRRSGTVLHIHCILFCDFEAEMLADNTLVELRTEVEFKGLSIGRGIVTGDPAKPDAVRKSVGHLVSLDAYQRVPQINPHAVYFLPNPQPPEST